MLMRTAALLGIQRGSILRLAKSAVPHRHLCDTKDDVDYESDEEIFPSEPLNCTVDDFKDLLKTEEDRKKCHLILLEINSIGEETGRAPTSIRPRDMEDLLKASLFQRRKYYDYMFKREMSRKNVEQKKAILRLSREERLKNSKREVPPGLYPFIRKSSMFLALQGKRLAEAALFSQKVVFDFSFDEHMKNREKRNLAEQIQHCYAANKAHPFPFDLTVCNLEKGGFTERTLLSHFAVDDLRKVLIGTTEKCYTELFPKQDLVYLTPDAPYALQEWDHNKTYIIGGLVDLGPEKPWTLAKAKKTGIATARFPLVENLCLKPGAQKTLTLNTTLEILLEMKTKNDWTEALKKVPRRFVGKLGESNARVRSRFVNQVRREDFARKSVVRGQNPASF